jgi:hypothetical protein
MKKASWLVAVILSAVVIGVQAVDLTDISTRLLKGKTQPQMAQYVQIMNDNFDILATAIEAMQDGTNGTAYIDATNALAIARAAYIGETNALSQLTIFKTNVPASVVKGYTTLVFTNIGGDYTNVQTIHILP